MTKRECEKKLKEVTEFLNNSNNSTTFKYFSAIYTQKLYKECLKYNTDPDSIWFYYEAKNGKSFKT